MEKFFYAGSFDPFTLGHLDIVEKALEKYGSGVIAVADDYVRASFFDVTTRVQMVKEALAYKAKVSGSNAYRGVKVITYRDEKDLLNAVHNCGASIMVRGVRSEMEIAKERLSAEIDNRIIMARGWNVRQATIVGSSAYGFVSSSAVKELCERGEYIAAKSFVVPPVLNTMMEFYLYPVFVNVFGGDLQATSEKYKRFLLKKWKWLCYQMKRPYHNLTHIACLLNYLGILQPDLQWPSFTYIRGICEFCKVIFFHDCVENDISASFRELCEMTPDGYGKEMWSLFTATDHTKKKRSFIKDQQLIHDIDLAVLADDINYDSYMIGIRLEHLEVPLETYIEERVQVLRDISEELQLPTLGVAFEEKAKKNIAREIEFWNKVKVDGLPDYMAGLR